MQRKPLTIKQARVLGIIKKHIGANRKAPTLDELRQELTVKSLRTVTQYLESLERKGYISRRKNATRNIELREEPENTPRTISVPVVASVGCDDLSVFAAEPAENGVDEFLEVDRKFAEESGDIVAVRAVGDSMCDAGIESGDYILVQFTERVQNGDRVAAIIGDMVTVKRFERRDGVIILWPESRDPKYKPIIMHENFKIAGKVLCVIPAPRAEITEVVPLQGYEQIAGAS